jgi:transposase
MPAMQPCSHAFARDNNHGFGRRPRPHGGNYRRWCAVWKVWKTCLAFLDEAIRKIEQQIREHIDRHPDLKAQAELIDSIKGIGLKTAVRLLAEYQDVRGFTSARAMVAYAGLNPQLHESGRTVRGKPRLSKKGAARLRDALYWPAVVGMTHNPVLREFAERLRAHGKPNMVVIGAVMRKLIHLVYGVLKSGKPFDPHYAQFAA